MVRRTATPLAGTTLGILGLGEIGQEVARIAAALGCASSARGATRAAAGPRRGVSARATDEVLAQSDYVLLLLPATPETDNFIDADRLPG